MLNVMSKPAELPALIVASTQLTAPPRPTAGLVHVKAGPLVWVSETNVIPLGTESESVAFGAGSGPALVTVIAYVTLLPAAA
jgi:hypothetical protein